MGVLVDTSVWSLAFRRRRAGDSPAIHALEELIREGRAQVIGPIRQELLSGIKRDEDFERLRSKMRFFVGPDLTLDDYEMAAEFFNRCRSQGVQGSNTDFLICAVSHRRQMPILTTDRDFESFTKHLPIELHPFA